MSVPPPGQWGAHPEPPGFSQPGPGQPFQGQPPPRYHQPWYPPTGPPNKGNSTKWLIAGALVAVAAMAVIVVVLHSNSSDGSKGSTAASAIASANDNGPVTVITDEPSCGPWTPISNTLKDRTDEVSWAKRDASVPASAWSAEQRNMYQATATAMRKAADRTVALAKMTPHRVVRELYEQMIAYWRAYANSIPAYTPIDDQLALTANSANAAVVEICSAISFGSAEARAPLVPAPAPPTHPSSPGNLEKPARFLASKSSVCGDWEAAGNKFDAATVEWQKTDANIPASQWSPADKALNDAVGPVMKESNEEYERLGRASGNSTLEDFAVLSAQYGSAFVRSLPGYVSGDQYLYQVSSHAAGLVAGACDAVGS